MGVRTKLILTIALIEMLILAGLIVISMQFLETASREAFVKRLESRTTGLTLLVRDAVLNADMAELDAFAREYMKETHGEYLRISDTKQVLGKYGAVDNDIGDRKIDASFDTVDDGVFDQKKIIYLNEYPIGTVETGHSTRSVSLLVSSARQRLILFAGIEIAILVALAWLLGNLLARDLKHLRRQLGEVAQGHTGKYLSLSDASLFKEVAEAFNDMTRMIEEREQDRDAALDTSAQAMQALQAREESLELLLDTITDGVLIVDDELTIVDINEAAKSKTVPGSKPIPGQSVMGLLYDTADQNRLQDAIKRLSTLDEHLQRQNLGKVKLTGFGEHPVWVDLTAAVVTSGQTRRIVLAFRDLTHELTHHSELQRRELLNKAISVASLDGILVLNEQGDVADANPSAELLLGKARAQMVGNSIVSVLGIVEGEAGLLSDLGQDRTLNGGTTNESHKLLSIRGGNSEAFPVSYRMSQFFWSRQRYTTLLLRDLSEQRQTELSLVEAKETAEKASQAKSDFLSHVTHEIRSPLNATIGCIDLFSETHLDKQQRIFANSAKQSAEVLLSLVNNILDFARIESGTLELTEEIFNVVEIAESVLDIKSFQTDQREVSLSLVVDPAAEIECLGDSVRLRQVLLNLVDNALKFTNKGGVVIRVDVGESTATQQYLSFSVEDSGIGIPDSKQADIFNAFTQVDNSDATLHGGSGLGLAISRELVERMGGELLLESALGNGSRFHFELPLVCTRTRDVPDTSNKFAWVIAGNAVFLRSLDAQLSCLGVRTLCVSEQRELAVCAAKPDLVFIDQPASSELAAVVEYCGNDVPVYLMADSRHLCDYDGTESGLISKILEKPVRYSRLKALVYPSNAVATGEFRNVATDTDVALQSGRNSARLLLAEDSPANQLVAVTMLKQAGYPVFVANNGEEVLEALENWHFDLVLMDLRMPRMDGLEATRRIRTSGKSYAQITIVALTANATPEDEDRCRKAGMDAFLGKPFKVKDLLSIIDNQLNISEREPVTEKATLPLLDTLVIERLEKETSAAVVMRMVKVFMTEVKRRHGDMLRALDVEDCHGVENEAHTLKSNASTFGAAYLASLAREVEQACKRMDKERVVGLIPELTEVVEKTLKEYGAYFGQSGE